MKRRRACATETGGIGKVQHRIAARAELHALVSRRQKSAAPQPVVERLVVRIAAALRDHDDERRQVVVLAAQSVGQPGADRRPAGKLEARLEERDGGIVIDRLGVHRLDEAKSSATFAVCGISSLTHAPEAPCCWNWNTDGATGKLVCVDVMPVSRWPIRDRVRQFRAAQNPASRGL